MVKREPCAEQQELETDNDNAVVRGWPALVRLNYKNVGTISIKLQCLLVNQIL